MAEVFLGKTSGFDRLLAIKRVLPELAEDDDFIEMFTDEARVSSLLNHPEIVQVFDFGKYDDTFYLATEYVPGRDLRAVLNRCGKRSMQIPIPLAMFIAAKVCGGLSYAHRRKDLDGADLNIVHRDISPPNIIFSWDGAVKVIDFGVAKSAARTKGTRVGMLKGKVAYMSPEQAQGLEVDHRTDLYALGAVLYQMLTGQMLVQGNTEPELLRAARDAKFSRPSEHNRAVSRELDALVMKVLAREREDRFEDALALRNAIISVMPQVAEPEAARHLADFLQKIFDSEYLADQQRLAEFAAIDVAPTPAPRDRRKPGRYEQTVETEPPPPPATPPPADHGGLPGLGDADTDGGLPGLVVRYVDEPGAPAPAPSPPAPAARLDAEDEDDRPAPEKPRRTASLRAPTVPWATEEDVDEVDDDPLGGVPAAVTEPFRAMPAAPKSQATPVRVRRAKSGGTPPPAVPPSSEKSPPGTEGRKRRVLVRPSAPPPPPQDDIDDEGTPTPEVGPPKQLIDQTRPPPPPPAAAGEDTVMWTVPPGMPFGEGAVEPEETLPPRPGVLFDADDASEAHTMMASAPTAQQPAHQPTPTPPVPYRRVLVKEPPPAAALHREPEVTASIAVVAAPAPAAALHREPEITAPIAVAAALPSAALHREPEVTAPLAIPPPAASPNPIAFSVELPLDDFTPTPDKPIRPVPAPMPLGADRVDPTVPLPIAVPPPPQQPELLAKTIEFPALQREESDEVTEKNRGAAAQPAAVIAERAEGQERRAYSRLPVRLNVFRREGLKFVQDVAMDLSLGGVGLGTRTLLMPGTERELTVATPDGSVEIPFTGEVVHVRSVTAEVPYLTGVRIVRMEPGVVPKYEALILEQFSGPAGKRSNNRVRFSRSAFWKEPGPHPAVTGAVVDIGFTGATLQLGREAKKGAKGLLTLSAPADSRLISMPAEIEAVTPADDGWRLGVRFAPDSEGQELIGELVREVLLSKHKTPEARATAKRSHVRVGDFDCHTPIYTGAHCVVFSGVAVSGPFAGQKVVLKRLRPESATPKSIATFMQEAEFLKGFEHPCAAKTLGALRFADECWQAMELVDGRSLDGVIAVYARTRRLAPVAPVLSVLSEVARLLSHRRAAVRALKLPRGHLCLKPSGVLISRDGHTKVADFGRLDALDAEAQDKGAKSFAYVPPELWADAESEAADVFAIAVLIYESLTAVAPFRATTLEDLRAAARRGAVPIRKLNPEVPEALGDLIAQALSFDPKKRPQRLFAFLADLEKAAPFARGEQGLKLRASLADVKSVSRV